MCAIQRFSTQNVLICNYYIHFFVKYGNAYIYSLVPNENNISYIVVEHPMSAEYRSLHNMIFLAAEYHGSD